MQQLQDSLQSVTKALLARNSRFAEEILSASTPQSGENPIVWHHIRSLAELTLRINEEPQLKAYDDLTLLAEKVITMMSSLDPSESRLKTIQEIFERISKDVQALMKKTPNNVNRGVNLILAANQYVQIAFICHSRESGNPGSSKTLDPGSSPG